MSVELQKKLTIVDSSGDTAQFATAPFDEGVDWTDDAEAVLAKVQYDGGREVYLTRADLRELRNFLEEILDADAMSYDAADEDEQED